MTAHWNRLPPVHTDFRLPFQIGALHHIGLDFLVDPDPVRRRLESENSDLDVTLFDSKACISMNYQLYFAQFAGGGSLTQEIELNIIAHPKASSTFLPDLCYRQFAEGQDQTKLNGCWRIQVVCDSPLAIKAGKELFGEPKRPAWFETVMPSPNAAPSGTWRVTCKRAGLENGQKIVPSDKTMFSFEIDLTEVTPMPVSMAPITMYGRSPSNDNGGRTIAAPFNVCQPYLLYPLAPEDEDRYQVSVIEHESGIGADLGSLVGDAKPVSAWAYQSPPVASQHRPYYARTTE
ncbi:hypothetical protein [Streptomyces marianii]|uniref:Acetoacetate decarboxylase n=1 Tax=Streptomyces marianii TaxID=1817406 RepID=A0A5R9DYJ6_9ACTN|nr:hypothetical protein [Streptomyces marianii]TLQ42670.1 hypothetical protein FEF34_05320 [Streptomyces marianii]